MKVNQLSNVDLLRDLDGIIDFDAEVAHGALDLGVPEQELHCTKVTGPAVDQYSLRAPQRVGAELGRIEPNAGDPLMTRRAYCLVVSPCSAFPRPAKRY